MTNDNPTPVLFRVDKSGEFKGYVTAVFPREVNRNGTFLCYSHTEQHGICTRGWVLSKTRPATPDEYADLKRELESIGYTLKVYARMPRCASPSST